MTNRTTLINYFLFALCGVFVVLYVVQANAIAAQTWQSHDAQERMAKIQSVRETLLTQQTALSDREKLAVLAQNAGMIPVPAQSVVYLIQDRPVAARSGF